MLLFNDYNIKHFLYDFNIFYQLLKLYYLNL